MAPRVGFEPTTLRLTAGCSAVELPRNIWLRLIAQVVIIPEPFGLAIPNRAGEPKFLPHRLEISSADFVDKAALSLANSPDAGCEGLLSRAAGTFPSSPTHRGVGRCRLPWRARRRDAGRGAARAGGGWRWEGAAAPGGGRSAGWPSRHFSAIPACVVALWRSKAADAPQKGRSGFFIAEFGFGLCRKSAKKWREAPTAGVRGQPVPRRPVFRRPVPQSAPWQKAGIWDRIAKRFRRAQRRIRPRNGAFRPVHDTGP